MDPTTTVLLVEPDRLERDRVALWLTDAGYEVWVCPGPDPDTRGCVGLAGNALCALAASADVAVVDRATPASEELGALYRSSGGRVLWLDRPAERRELLESVYLFTKEES